MRENGSYFCGWYFRCQSESQTVALIPAIHISEGQRTGSIQIISGDGCRHAALPDGTVSAKAPRAELGGCIFREDMLRLSLHAESADAEGELRFEALTPLRCDIMGPFRYVPFMECRHSVFSMRHRVNGQLRVGDRDYRFSNGDGYIEGDRGRSFPRRYAWTQCFLEGGSLMLSVAEIPLGPVRFTGTIGAVCIGGREYRLATYLGARVMKCSGGELVIRQGDMTLTAALLERTVSLLRAPENGAMTRLIRENAACRARYELVKGDQTLLAVESDNAAFEYEYDR